MRMPRRIIFNFICYGIAIAILYFVYQSYQGLFRPMPLPDESMVYEYHKGASVKALSKDLAKKSLIPSAFMFEWYVRFTGSAKYMHAGEYQLTQGMTPNDLIKKMRQGDIVMHTLRVAEGSTISDLLKAIRENPAIDHTISMGDDWVKQEGMYLPETYFFPKNEKDVDILNRAHQALLDYATEKFEKRDKSIPFKNINEVLIVASILEKEASLPEERTKIARVIINRLERKMPLQMDPTVIYGMGSAFNGTLTKKDLQKPGPYNTYLNVGLPPTPICFTSKESIWAALHPAEGDYMYFVSEGDGSHYFSDNLKEHNQAVIKYRQQLKKGVPK